MNNEMLPNGISIAPKPTSLTLSSCTSYSMTHSWIVALLNLQPLPITSLPEFGQFPQWTKYCRAFAPNATLSTIEHSSLPEFLMPRSLPNLLVQIAFSDGIEFSWLPRDAGTWYISFVPWLSALPGPHYLWYVVPKLQMPISCCYGAPVHSSGFHSLLIPLLKFRDFQTGFQSLFQNMMIPGCIFPRRSGHWLLGPFRVLHQAVYWIMNYDSRIVLFPNFHVVIRELSSPSTIVSWSQIAFWI